MIKTITLDGLTSVTVKESPFDMARFCWVRNRTEADVYISCTDPQCTPNADGVKCISAGECGMLDSESRETLYISGSGVVNIETTPFLVCPFNRGGKGGGSYELPIATTEILGGVMPDGTTINVDENGVISAVGSGEGGGVTIDSALSDTSENPVQNKIITSALNNKAESNHVHSYAGSSSEGGSATSAVKLDSSAGSTVNPVYFSKGKPVACAYTLGKSVPSNAVFTDTKYTLPKATTSTLGGVMVDGNTITIDSSGKISASGGNAKLLVNGTGSSFTFTGSYSLFFFIISSFAVAAATVTNSSGIVVNGYDTTVGKYNNGYGTYDVTMTVASNKVSFHGLPSSSPNVTMKLYGI